MESQKITSQRTRWYEDACGAAHGLELVGERWALLIVRELIFGPRRFSALRAGLPGLSANVLTQRLEGLEASGIVRRGKLPPPASTPIYELTPWGYEAAPIFTALGAWAARSPGHDTTLALSAASLMLSFRTMFSPARAEGLHAEIGFRFGDDGFRVSVSPEGLHARRADPQGADLILSGTPPIIAGLVYGGVPAEALKGSGELEVEGDRALLGRFARLFPLPDKAPVHRPSS